MLGVQANTKVFPRDKHHLAKHWHDKQILLKLWETAAWDPYGDNEMDPYKSSSLEKGQSFSKSACRV